MCADKKVLSKEKILINRVDIDFSVKKAVKLGKIFNDLGIKATFFIRLHAPEYNPFSFENYQLQMKVFNILKQRSDNNIIFF